MKIAKCKVVEVGREVVAEVEVDGCLLTSVSFGVPDPSRPLKAGEEFLWIVDGDDRNIYQAINQSRLERQRFVGFVYGVLTAVATLTLLSVMNPY